MIVTLRNHIRCCRWTFNILEDMGMWFVGLFERIQGCATCLLGEWSHGNGWCSA